MCPCGVVKILSGTNTTAIRSRNSIASQVQRRYQVACIRITMLEHAKLHRDCQHDDQEQNKGKVTIKMFFPQPKILGIVRTSAPFFFTGIVATPPSKKWFPLFFPSGPPSKNGSLCFSLGDLLPKSGSLCFSLEGGRAPLRPKRQFPSFAGFL